MAAGLADEDANLERVSERYAIAITPEMAALIEGDKDNDPIATQFVPSASELTIAPDETPDPTGDDPHTPMQGLVHRYPDRVLLKPVHVCPVYCRFCFRRERVGPGGEAMSDQEIASAVSYIASRPGIFEVIVTGGDPLMLAPRRVAALVSALGTIPHVRVIRWHSRVPIVDPGRAESKLIAALTSGTKASWLALHCNHPRELTDDTVAAIGRLAAAGIVLVSQTVLLRGVNDSAATLADLFQRLIAIGVRPFYLHQLDQAPGTSHFRVPIPEGQAIMRELRGRISGIAMPTYILDIPGGFGKVPIGPHYLKADPEGASITDPAGAAHAYPLNDDR